MVTGDQTIQDLPVVRGLDALGEADAALFHWIYRTDVWPLVDGIAILVARGTPPLLLLILLLLWFVPGRQRRERRRLVILTLLAILLALGLSTALSLVYYRERPFIAWDIPVKLPDQPSSSFPSSHLAGGAAFAVMTSLLSPLASLITWLMVWVMAVARVRIGVHYPLDVVGGALFGWAMGALIRRNRESLRSFTEAIRAATEELLPF